MIAGHRLACLYKVSGFVELTCLFVMRLIWCYAPGGEEWALFLLGWGSHCVGLAWLGFPLITFGGIMLGILVMVSWPRSLISGWKGARGFATSPCGF